VGDINQHTRTQADAGKISLVGAHGDLVIAAACIKIPVDWIHPFLRQDFILKNVDWLNARFLSPLSFFGVSPMEKV
jgi:hypothetical protein